MKVDRSYVLATSTQALAQTKLSNEIVSTVLKADVGDQAELVSYYLSGCAEHGDNISGEVVGLSVERLGCSERIAYLAKLWPGAKSSSLIEEMVKLMVKKEMIFYKDVRPLMDRQLIAGGSPLLRIPEYFHSIDTEGSQAIFIRDMRSDNCQMPSRKAPLDKEHAKLALMQLAAFHAASVLVIQNCPEFNKACFEELYDILMKKDNSQEMYDASFERYAKLATAKSFTKIADFLRSMKGSTKEIASKLLEPSDKFNVFCHGDVWNGNFLFEYKSSGTPISCFLIDFQVTRIGSPALDLNFFIYNCLAAEDILKPADFIEIYFDEFSSILNKAKVEVPFSLDELKKECVAKRLFGFKMGIDRIYRVQADKVHTVNDYRTKPLETLIKEEDDCIMGPDFKDDRMVAMFNSTFTDDLLKCSTPEALLKSLTYSP